jgi:transposase, IS5 family
LSLLNEAREISEQIIDTLHPLTGMEKKVRTYRRNARKDYLALVKQRRPGNKKYRKAVGQQLRYLKRNLLVLFRLLFVRVLTHIDRYVTAVLEAQLHWLHTLTARQTDKLKQSPLLDRAF